MCEDFDRISLLQSRLARPRSPQTIVPGATAQHYPPTGLSNRAIDA